MLDRCSMALLPSSGLMRIRVFFFLWMVLFSHFVPGHSSLFGQQAKPAAASPIATFVDIAEKAGLTTPNIFGGVDTKKYIIETTGNGVALFDYDNDGWLD